MAQRMSSAHVPSAYVPSACALSIARLAQRLAATCRVRGALAALSLQVGGRGQGSKLGSKLTKLFLDLSLAFALSVCHSGGRHTQHVRLVELYERLQGIVWEESRLKRVACERA